MHVLDGLTGAESPRPVHPRPVVYRTMDFKTNEFRELKGGGKEHEPQEQNPCSAPAAATAI